MLGTVEYHSGKMMAYGGVLLAFGAAWLLFVFDDSPDITFLVAGLFVAGLGAALIYKSQFSPSAITFDQQGMTVNLLFKDQRIEWSELVSTSEDRHTIRFAELIPIFSTRLLMFRVTGGMIGTKKIALFANLLDMPDGGLAGLRNTIQRMQILADAGMSLSNNGALARHDSGANIDLPIRHAEQARTPDYDPDAAFAGMMSAREEPFAPGMPEAPMDDRNPRPPASGAVPARPVFGRKAG